MDTTSTTEAVKTGVGLGTIIAVVLSWERNKSIVWAIIHGFLAWFYVVYYALTDKQGSQDVKKLSFRTSIYVVLSIFLVHVLLIIVFMAYHLIKT